MKTTYSSIITAVSAFLALIAEAPPELQKQIPMAFPDQYRGFIVLILGFIALASHVYGGKNTSDSKPTDQIKTP